MRPESRARITCIHAGAASQQHHCDDHGNSFHFFAPASRWQHNRIQGMPAAYALLIVFSFASMDGTIRSLQIKHRMAD
jgi:hypothetical protein